MHTKRLLEACTIALMIGIPLALYILNALVTFNLLQQLSSQ